MIFAKTFAKPFVKIFARPFAKASAKAFVAAAKRGATAKELPPSLARLLWQRRSLAFGSARRCTIP